MQTFLQMVAHDLYIRHGNDLSRTAVVFPNKRAGLFFNEHLAAESTRPLWSPAYVTISELYQELSELKKGDPIRLVCELHKVFCEVTGSEEALDDFYFWGELLISDFDDLDKHRVNAHQLFSNLQELKAMDDLSFLDDEQQEAIRRFFQNFSVEKNTELKEKFISLWNKLEAIYTRYRERLTELGIAYEGMMYRRVMDELDIDALPYDRYVFVGFNVLNKVEHDLFSTLQKAGRALFYWDYDAYYTTRPDGYTHEAGEFILRNLRDFGNALPKEYFDVMSQPKQVQYISAPTENGQARYVNRWVNEESSSKDTAIVLCNESLLMPVLHSIPEVVREVNITMGFPLSDTPIYSFINALVRLHTEGYNSKSGRYYFDAVLGVLRHPYASLLSPRASDLEDELTRNNRFYPLPSELTTDRAMELLFTPANGIADICRRIIDALKALAVCFRAPAETEEEEPTLFAEEEQQEELFNQLYREALFKGYTLVGRMLSLIEEGLLAGVRTDTFRRLLGRLLTTATIPFHGEPAVGMQIMGVLETRNLDFRNVLMLSVNEGQLPKGGSDSSFIPYNLRKAFGMTTIEHKNAVFAYYFYRLIQRAERVTLMYNTSSEGLNRGEMSRFMLQYLVEAPQEIERYYLEAGQMPRRVEEVCVEKSEEMLRAFCAKYDAREHPERFFSPSALNTYLDCRMKFYYRYVQEIKPVDEVTDEIDNALFGTIFHRAAQLVYIDLTAHGKEIQRTDIEALLKNDVRLQGYVDTAFKEEFFHIAPTAKAEYNGTQLIHQRVITSYLRQLLRHDLGYAPFRMEGMEEPVSEEMKVHTPYGELTIRVGGKIDRLDSCGDTLRIVDYKTGGSPKTPEGVEQLFLPAENRPNYIFQTFLYAALMCRRQPLKVAPALLYIHKAAQEEYSPVIEMGAARQPKLPVSNFAFYEDEFRSRLRALLEEIFNDREAFTQTNILRNCEYCDFKRLCGR